MDAGELKDRTKKFALRILKLADALHGTLSSTVVAKQIIRSGTSVAANYRSTLRSRSEQEFISKLNIVIEECDETLFWLEMIIDSNMMQKDKVEPLRHEADELVAIFCSTQKTMKNKKMKNQKSEIRNQK
jgi:four helix bundle protein